MVRVLDDEVFAVIMAALTVSSVFAAATIAWPDAGQEYLAIGLLNSDCQIGDYPVSVYDGGNLSLCVYIENNLKRASLLQVRYKLGTSADLPTNTSPSQRTPIIEWTVLLDKGANTTLKINVPVVVGLGPGEASKRVVIMFELWELDPSSNEWIYTGKWVHLYVTVRRPALGG